MISSCAATLPGLLKHYPILCSLTIHLSTLDLYHLSLTSQQSYLAVHSTPNPINAILQLTHCTSQTTSRASLTSQGSTGTLRGWKGSIAPPLQDKNPKCKTYSKFRCQECSVPVCGACKPQSSSNVRHALDDNGYAVQGSERWMLKWELPLAYGAGDDLRYARATEHEAGVDKDWRRRHFCQDCAIPKPTLDSLQKAYQALQASVELAASEDRNYRSRLYSSPWYMPSLMGPLFQPFQHNSASPAPASFISGPDIIPGPQFTHQATTTASGLPRSTSAPGILLQERLASNEVQCGLSRVVRQANNYDIRQPRRQQQGNCSPPQFSPPAEYHMQQLPDDINTPLLHAARNIKHGRLPCACAEKDYKTLVEDMLAVRPLCWDCGVTAWKADRAAKPTYKQKVSKVARNPITGEETKETLGYNRFCSASNCARQVSQDTCTTICAWCDGWIDNANLDFGAPPKRPATTVPAETRTKTKSMPPPPVPSTVTPSSTPPSVVLSKRNTLTSVRPIKGGKGGMKRKRGYSAESDGVGEDVVNEILASEIEIVVAATAASVIDTAIDIATKVATIAVTVVEHQGPTVRESTSNALVEMEGRVLRNGKRRCV